jgi:hypothetical protein
LRAVDALPKRRGPRGKNFSVGFRTPIHFVWLRRFDSKHDAAAWTYSIFRASQ